MLTPVCAAGMGGGGLSHGICSRGGEDEGWVSVHFPLLFSLTPQPKEWCHTQAGGALPPQLRLYRDTFADTLRSVFPW